MDILKVNIKPRSKCSTAMYRTTALVISLALGGLPIYAQTKVVASAKSGGGQRPQVVVFTGDDVIPQLVDGGGWKTTLKFVNLENHTVTFSILFNADDGSSLFIPIIGVGVVDSVDVTLQTAGSVTIETAARDPQLAQGWALITRQNNSDSIGGFAIFRQRVPGIPDQEAVVPIVNKFESHFVLIYDNSGPFLTAIALANPSQNLIHIPLTIRDESGQIIDQQSFTLGPYAHAAFSLPSVWSSTAGGRGAIEFLTSGFGVGALGLRFNGAAFTSFDVIENINWVTP